MLAVTAYASSWLSLYKALFPMIDLTKTSDDMLLQYDKLQDSDGDPVEIAALLLSVAITARQAPDDAAGRGAESSRDAPLFVSDSPEVMLYLTTCLQRIWKA